LGLFDVHGNVWNWVADPGYAYPTASGNNALVDGSDLYRGAMLDITDSKSSRVLRGGSLVNHPTEVRSPTRYIYRPSNRGNGGLRVARTLP
jgi:formylglycine-generating enzyme required for sulfatase activity